MISPRDIGDRHERPVAGLGDHGGIVVRLSTGPLTRRADQLIVACLINLLCRMTGSVGVIELDSPSAELRIPLADGQGPGPVFERMKAFANWAVGDAVKVVRRSSLVPNYTISVGAALPSNSADLYVTGAGWIAWIGTETPITELTDGPNPIGPWFAASLAAGEVFKRARGLSRGRFALSDEGYDLWDGRTGPLKSLTEGPSLKGHTLPPFILVGAGAVGQGIIALLGVSKISTFVVTIDDDAHDGTNLNRCFVAGTEDVEHPKVNAVARYRSITELPGVEFEGTLQRFVQHGPLDDMPEAMRLAQLDDSFEVIFSAVDKNTSRWDVQGLKPHLVIGGSTDQLTAKAMTYGAQTDGPCLACHNPREEDGARRRELEQRIRGLDEVKARAFLTDLGIDPEEIDAVLDYLRNEPVCGSVGDRVLGKLAGSSTGEFSVSFVSMAAAVLALVRLLQATTLKDGAPARKVMSSIAFRNLSYSDDGLSRDLSCPMC